MKTIMIAVLILVAGVLISMCAGCASEPLTYEQQRAIYAAGIGLQNAGAQIQADARMRQQAALSALYQPVQLHWPEPMRIYSTQPNGMGGYTTYGY